MPLLDQTYINRFRGVLGWNGFIDGQGTSVPPVETELYISNLQMPIRKPKINESVTISQLEPNTAMQIGSAAIFYGSPDLLQMELSGWIITLQNSSRQWLTYDTNGTALNPALWGNIPYSEVINAYISGKVNLTSTGAPRRKDPDYYISPQGYQYLSPIISTYESQFQVGAKKQLFNMTLLLES